MYVCILRGFCNLILNIAKVIIAEYITQDPTPTLSINLQV